MSLAATEARAAARVAAPRLAVPDRVGAGGRACWSRWSLIDGQPAAAALIVLGFALGVVFLKAEFSFTASWRRLIVRGQADGFLGGAAADRHRGGRRSFRSPALVPGLRRRDRAARAVAADRRVRVRHRHAARQRLRLRHALHRRRRLRPHDGHARVLHRRQRDRQPASAGIPARSAASIRSSPPNYLGPWGGLAATLGEPRRRGRRVHRDRAPARRGVHAVAHASSSARSLIGLLSIGVFAAGRHPWSVTFGFTVWGAKIATRARLRSSPAPNSGNGRGPSARSATRSSATPRASPTWA